MKKSTNIRLFVSFLLALSICFIFLSANTSFASDKVIKWKMQSVYPKTNIGWKQSVEKICDLIKERSGGRVIIEAHPGGSLMPSKEMFNATKRGVIQMSHGPSLYYRTKIPMITIAAGLPFAFSNIWQISYFMKFSGYEKAIKKALLKKHALYYYTDRASEAAIVSKKPINSFEDFKGLKTRTSGLLATYLKELGGAPSYASGSESYAGLASGVFDAAIWGKASGAEKLGFFEVCKYISQPNIANVAYTTWLINKKAFESLPKDIQKLFDEIFELHYWERTNQSIYDESSTVERQVSKGLKVINLSKADQKKMRQVALKLWEKESKDDPELSEWVEKLKVYLKDIGEL